jgi:hypothetical protein
MVKRRSWVAALALLAVAPSAQAASTPVKISVVGTRADLVTGGDALVSIRVPRRIDASQIRVTVGSRDVTGAFAVRSNGRLGGLLEGLAEGRNALVAHVPGRPDARLIITNHPNGGPLFAGPQVQPWVCQPTAADAQCNQPPTFTLRYRSSVTGEFASYDPQNPPPDLATTTTDQGVTVPFVIRTESGYQDRDQYEISVLYDPAKPWTAFDPQPQFNHKLLITHGASCGIDHMSGTAPSTTTDVVNTASSPTEALGRGFAVMSTALDNAGHNCNIVTQAESLVMAKEHLVERYGTLRYTIGTGCSGGSLTQQQVSNAYPGVYQGILPQCSFPDAWSTGQQLVDYHLVRKYVEDPSRWGTGVAWTPLDIAAVEGHPNHVNSIILDSLYFTAVGDPTNPCAGVTAEQRYDPKTNPGGVRCTLADYMVNVMGRRPDGFAGRPLDNVGVQYGLDALKAGQITPAQFTDLNAKVGGANIDAAPTAERTAADEPALANAYRSGAINETNNQKGLAIIDLRGPDPGAFHDAYRAFAVRARLEQQNGTSANQVIWEGAAPLIGDVDYTKQGLLAMDRWLSAVEHDHRKVSRARKVIEDRPKDVHDQCSDGIGQTLQDEHCPAIVQIYKTPRMVAGESIATDANKCQLKPLRRSDYLPVEFTDAQFEALQKAFPSGVCDWSKPGVSQQPTIPWLTYADRVGGRRLGRAPVSKTVRGR